MGNKLLETKDIVIMRKEARLKKIANRIKRGKARKEELETFEQLKKELACDVIFNTYNKEFVIVVNKWNLKR